MKNVYGNTYLHIAARYNKIKMCAWLLKREVDVDVRNNDGNTALHLAAKHGHISICAMLLKHGANVNAANDKGHTPLRLTIQHCEDDDRYRTCEVLLKCGANPMLQDRNGKTSIDLTSSTYFKKYLRSFVATNGETTKAANKTTKTAGVC
jgi:ankyrin repeat protein